MSVAYTISGSAITVVVDFTPKAIAKSHPNHDRIRQMVADPATTEDMIRPLLDIPQTISNYTAGKVYVKNGKLYMSGAEVRTSLARKILDFIAAGDANLAEPLKLFLENVSQNPDPRAQLGLYDWLQASQLPITPDGYILAWKAVSSDYRSIHAPSDPRFDHRIGRRVEQERDECDADPDRTCSSGLHFCAASYLKSYAGGGHRVIVVKIHPKDVVAFPKDYNLAKGRACGYDVVGEMPFDQVANFYPQGKPVYDGFADVVKTVSPQIGEVYRRRDGKTVVITNSDRNLVFDHNEEPYFATDGRCNRPGRPDTPRDLVQRIEFKLDDKDFRVGDRWVLRDGRTVTITNVGSSIVESVTDDGWSISVYRENGRLYTRDAGKLSSADFVFNLDYGSRFAVGQSWRTAGGEEVRIVSIADTGLYPIRASNGADYTAEGRYHVDGLGSHDLTTRI